MAGPEFSGWYLRGDVGDRRSDQQASISSINPNPLIGAPADAFNSFYNPSMSASGLFDVGVGYQINNWLRTDATDRISRRIAFPGRSSRSAIPSLGYQNADFYRADTSSIIGLINGYVDLGTWYGDHPVRRRRRRLREQHAYRV